MHKLKCSHFNMSLFSIFSCMSCQAWRRKKKSCCFRLLHTERQAVLPNLVKWSSEFPGVITFKNSSFWKDKKSCDSTPFKFTYPPSVIFSQLKRSSSVNSLCTSCSVASLRFLSLFQTGEQHCGHYVIWWTCHQQIYYTKDNEHHWKEAKFSMVLLS